MEEHAPRNAFDIPKVFYFEAGNIHTGSRDVMRYRVEPKDKELHVEVWCRDICYELAGDALQPEMVFPLSEKGFEQMIAYLTEQYNNSISV